VQPSGVTRSSSWEPLHTATPSSDSSDALDAGRGSAQHEQYAASSHSSTTRADTSHGSDASSNCIMLTATCGDVRSTGRRQSEQGTVWPAAGHGEVSVELIAASA